MAKAATALGLDLGTSYIKAVEIHTGREGLELAAAAALPVPVGAMEGGLITDADALAGALADLLSSAPFSNRNTIVSISGQAAAVTRVIDMERMTAKDLATTMKMDLERHVPFPADEVETDFQAIPGGEDQPTMKVVLAAAQKEAIEAELTVLKKARLTTVGIEVPPAAAGRAVMLTQEGGQWGDGSGKTIAVVDMGFSGTTLSVFSNGGLTFVRGLNIGSDNINRAITNEFTIDREEAERIKCDFGIVLIEDESGEGGGIGFGAMGDYTAPGASSTGSAAYQDTVDGPQFDLPEDDDFSLPGGGVQGLEPKAPEPEAPAPAPEPAPAAHKPAWEVPQDETMAALGEVITPIISDLVAELERSLEFYQSRNPDHEVVKVFLTGGMTGLRNLALYVEGQLGLPVVIADVTAGMKLGPKVDPEQARKLSPLLAVATGLAVRDLY
jgi:type IV pilus assembly protein PilM